MPVDFDESEILGKLQDLEDEINAISKSIGILETLKRPEFEEAYSKIQTPLYRTLERVKDMKYHQEMQLKIHRQKVKERGVKY